MKRILCMLTASLLAALPLRAQLRESYHVVKRTDWDRKVTHEVMSETDMRAFADEQRVLERVMSRALSLAQAEWEKDEKLRGKPFPRRVATLDTLSKMATFDDKAKAEERARNSGYRYEDREAKQRQAADKQKGRGVSKEMKAREAEKDRVNMIARTMLEAKIQEVLSQPSRVPSGFAAPAAPAKEAE